MSDVPASIFVIDDDPEICKVLSLVLQKTGYRVTTSLNGEEALSLMEAAVPDLVLLDIMMPQIDGLEVMRRMRDSVRLQDVPVVAFTALSSRLIEKELFDLGVRGFMRKPLHLSDLTETVQMELRRGRVATSAPLPSSA